MSAVAIVTRRVEFDAGHRLQHHNGKCKNIHGHRYVIDVSVAGGVQESEGAPDRGMVVDFAVLDQAINHVVGDWDHALMLENTDPLWAQLHGVKLVSFQGPPTAENMAAIVGTGVAKYLAEAGRYELRVAKVRVYETPKAWADWGEPW